MSGFKGYLSTVPVVFAIWLTFTAGLIIEINRLFPDGLVFLFKLKIGIELTNT